MRTLLPAVMTVLAAVATPLAADDEYRSGALRDHLRGAELAVLAGDRPAATDRLNAALPIAIDIYNRLTPNPRQAADDPTPEQAAAASLVAAIRQTKDAIALDDKAAAIRAVRLAVSLGSRWAP
jgi:hypothetical protein